MERRRERAERQAVRRASATSRAVAKRLPRAAARLADAVPDLDRDSESAVSGPQPIVAPIVLHGAFDGRRLLLWGETRPQAVAVSTARGKRLRDAAVPPSPFDPGDSGLIAALVAGGVTPTNLRVESAVVWLPSVDATPVASRGLVADPPGSLDQVELLPWTISAAAMPWDAAIELLCQCAGRHTLTPGVIIGEDLAYWTAAMRLAAALAARQHFLPDLVEEEGVLLARWRPAPTYSRRAGDRAACRRDARSRAARWAAPTSSAAPRPRCWPGSSNGWSIIWRGLMERIRAPCRSRFDSLDAQWLDALRRPDPALARRSRRADRA